MVTLNSVTDDWVTFDFRPVTFPAAVKGLTTFLSLNADYHGYLEQCDGLVYTGEYDPVTFPAAVKGLTTFLSLKADYRGYREQCDGLIHTGEGDQLPSLQQSKG